MIKITTELTKATAKLTTYRTVYFSYYMHKRTRILFRINMKR